MAEDDGGEKTEAATPKRRQEARDAGNIAKSHDLVAAATLISILILLNIFGANVIGALRTIMQEFFSSRSLGDVSFGAGLGDAVLRAIMEIGAAMAPLFIGVALTAIALNLAQSGFYLNFERIAPNFAAANPLRGLGKIFSFRGPGGAKFAMSLLKLLLVAATAYSAIAGKMASIVTVQSLSFLQIFGLGAEVIYQIALRIGILLFVLALIDYAYQRWHMENELKMSKQEVKEEMKSMEGDPRVKQRRRQVMLQRAKERLKKEVPRADVIITNPTHFAIALMYKADTMNAPKVVAKGQDLIAQRIRELAVEHGIPIIERAPLARAIYRLCGVGDEIPEQFYSAVAEILAYVYELTGKNRRQLAS